MVWISFVIGLVAVFVAVLLTRQTVLGKMSGELQASKTENEMLKQQLLLQKQEAQRQLDVVKEDFRQQQETRRIDFQRQMEQQSQLVKEQVENVTARLLQQRSDELQQGNRQQMESIMKPLRDQLANMQTVINQSRESHASNTSSLKTAIENMLKQSQLLGEEAKNLTDALNNKSKVQGDWGEQVLESILEESGLRRDHEYFVQNSYKDDDGGSLLRPDVVVNCPDNRCVIVDSKVSLTAYVRYVGANNDEERIVAEKENYESLWQHVKELAEKKYYKVVPNSIKTVLMFVPNEGSYILALRHDPQLGQKAFKEGVLIINPTNLMLSLQLIYNLWQSNRQAQNVEKIIKQSAGLYDKVVGFTETFLSLGDSIEKAQTAFDTAKSQLSEGRGNIVKRLSDLKKMGVNPTKKLPVKIKDEEDEDDE